MGRINIECCKRLILEKHIQFCCITAYHFLNQINTLSIKGFQNHTNYSVCVIPASTKGKFPDIFWGCLLVLVLVVPLDLAPNIATFSKYFYNVQVVQCMHIRCIMLVQCMHIRCIMCKKVKSTFFFFLPTIHIT
jgi:hypothetical protein